MDLIYLNYIKYQRNKNKRFSNLKNILYQLMVDFNFKILERVSRLIFRV